MYYNFWIWIEQTTYNTLQNQHIVIIHQYNCASILWPFKFETTQFYNVHILFSTYLRYSIMCSGKNQRPFIRTSLLLGLSININTILQRTSKLTYVTTYIISSCDPSHTRGLYFLFLFLFSSTCTFLLVLVFIFGYRQMGVFY